MKQRFASGPIPAAVILLVTFLAGFDPVRVGAESPVLLSPQQPAPLRAAPPSGLLLRPGAPLGETSKDQTYIVLEEYRTQTGIGRTQAWVEVAPIDLETGRIDLAAKGWVYYGERDLKSRAPSPNFTIKDPNAVPTRSLGNAVRQIGVPD